jgi:Cu2+-exporting ATPase
LPAPAATPTPGARQETPEAGAANREPLCLHCGLPVPAAARAEDETPFCCSGCATAYAVILECGLGRYYRLAERRGAAVVPQGRSYEEFDHPAFHGLYVHHRGELAETELYLEGIHCSSCVWLIERAPLSLPGVAGIELDWTRGRVRIAWDDAQTRLSRIAGFLGLLGYRAHPFRGGKADARRRAEDRAMIARIGVAAAIAVNVMLAAFALYCGWFGGMEPVYREYFRWVSLLLVTPALLFPGQVFFRGAWAALRTRTLHMDLPIAIALAAGYARGVVNTITGRGPIYLDGVAMLIFLLLLGRALQLRAQRAATDSAELLYSLSPSTARVVEPEDRVRERPAEALLPGMVLEVRVGDTVAADGVAARGESEVDTSLLTGETRLRAVGPGDPVFAGSVNRGSTLYVRVEQTGEASRLGRILAQVEAGARRRAPLVRVADRMAGAFVAVVLMLAAVTAWWWLGRDPSAALDRAIALLIVTCPCALALATPLAVTVAIGRAARAGILVKGGDALERLARPGRLILDKTGTVTEGRVSLAAWCGSEQVKPLVLALERHSGHPIAHGFTEAWPALAVPPAGDLAYTMGGGLEGRVAGQRVVVGSPAFVKARLAATEDPAVEGRPGALTPVWVAVDGRLEARAWFGDPVRADAAAALGALARRGWQLSLLSGDDPAVVRDVARRIRLPDRRCRGAASPEDKLRAIEAARGPGATVMVGDGVNDAAAIARADVGIGVSGGAEACLAVADVFLARPGLTPLVELVTGAERTLRVIRRNIAWSLVYNLAGAALAMTGVINPLIAAVLMPASSLTVVLASWSARTFETRAGSGTTLGPPR